MKIFENQKIRRIAKVAAILLAIALLVILITHGRHYFSRRSIRQIQSEVRSFGVWSPLAVIGLIFLSTIVPPLPLPIPLIEISAGIIFGFWGGFLLVWFSQVGSSLLAFEISRFFGKRFFKNALNNGIWNVYRRYLNERGPLAVFTTRAAMAAPFNITSFLAGLTQMKVWSFTLATALGVIPESLLFTFIGSKIRSIHINLWYLFILVVVIGGLGSFFTFLMVRFLNLKKAT